MLAQAAPHRAALCLVRVHNGLVAGEALGRDVALGAVAGGVVLVAHAVHDGGDGANLRLDELRVVRRQRCQRVVWVQLRQARRPQRCLNTSDKDHSLEHSFRSQQGLGDHNDARGRAHAKVLVEQRAERFPGGPGVSAQGGASHVARIAQSARCGPQRRVRRGCAGARVSTARSCSDASVAASLATSSPFPASEQLPAVTRAAVRQNLHPGVLLNQPGCLGKLLHKSVLPREVLGAALHDRDGAAAHPRLDATNEEHAVTNPAPGPQRHPILARQEVS